MIGILSPCTQRMLESNAYLFTCLIQLTSKAGSEVLHLLLPLLLQVWGPVKL